MHRFLGLLLVGLCALGLARAEKPAAPAESVQWKAGEHYFVIDPPQPTATGSKIEVLEVFSYACPHCAHFQPTADRLRAALPSYASFQYMPAIFNASWEPFARAFYTAQSLGVLDATHQALFDALHVQKQPLFSLDSLAGFYAQHGVDRAKFMATANSFEVESKLMRAREIVQKDGVDGTPSVVVNGRYRVSGGSAGSYEKLVDLVLWLVAKEHGDAAKGG